MSGDQTFCSTTYDVTFAMFDKIDVKGDSTHPLFGCSRRPKPARAAATSSGTSPSSWSTRTERW